MKFDLIEDPQHLIDKWQESVLADPYSVCLTDVLTFPWDWVVVEPGVIREDVIARIIEHGYDQVPMRVPESTIGWRLVSARVIGALHSEGSPIAGGVGSLPNDIAPVGGIYVTIADLIAVLGHSRAALLYEQWDEPDPKGVSGRIFGLLTIADLNRRAFRKAMFDLFLDLETELASQIRSHYPASTAWVELISEPSQVRVLGSWELARRRSLQIDLLEGAMLPDLIEILRGSDEMRASLGYASKTQVEKALNHIVPIRNAVMHPVKSLVLSQQDVDNLGKAISSALSLIDRIRAVGKASS